MAENFPVPPPPPPHMNKPVPPPPPGKAPGMPPIPGSMPSAVTPTFPSPAAMPGKAAPVGMPTGMPTGMLGRPVGGAPTTNVEQRIQEMERRFQDQDSSKKTLENQLSELQRQLKEEHEKVIVQSLRAKEEESLSTKVEEQLRGMQEKLRREKYEQELHDSRQKAEGQLKELERRLLDERETWMITLKNQLKERETVEREVEQNLTRRLQDVEKRYQSEKGDWTLAVRQKEEETNQLRRELQFEMEKLRENLQEKEQTLEEVRDAMLRERRTVEQQGQTEIRAMQAQLETQMREAGAWKAQLALLQNQIHQAETTHREEKVRWQAQLEQHDSLQKEERLRWQTQFKRLEEDQAEARMRLEAQLKTREEDSKREFARREQERGQHWEDIVIQMRSEKESLRHELHAREEDLAKMHIAHSETKRDFEVERSQWKAEEERIRRTVREEVLRDLPMTYKLQLDGERKKWDVEHHEIIRRLKSEIDAAGVDAQRMVSSRLEAETQRHQKNQLAMAQAFDQFKKESIEEKQHLETQLADYHELKKSWALKLESERQKLEYQHRAAVQEIKNQLTAALEGQKALTSKLDVDRHRFSQEEALWRESEAKAKADWDASEAAGKTLQKNIGALSEQMSHERAAWEKQTKEFLQRIAEAQMREARVRDEESVRIEELQKQVAHERQTAERLRLEFQSQIAGQAESVDQARVQIGKLQDDLRTAAHNLDAQEAEKVTLMEELQTMRSEIKTMAQAQFESKAHEQEMESTQGQLREAFNTVKADVVQAQSEHSRRETEWLQKEADWKKAQDEWAKIKDEWAKTPKMTVVDTGAAPVAGTMAAGPEAVKALTAIRQQMQEMQTLLAWMRPMKRPIGKAA